MIRKITKSTNQIYQQILLEDKASRRVPKKTLRELKGRTFVPKERCQAKYRNTTIQETIR
jgi:hypothetical protein